MSQSPPISPSRQRLFSPAKRFWLHACLDLFPGLISCVMATALGITMSIASRRPSLFSWLGLAAYATLGTWFLLSAIARIRRERTDYRWRHRFDAGLCQRCGFDLRSCTSVRCSECGAWHGKLPARQLEM